MMYSWERKFGDVVRDTERHLSKARETLDSSSSSHKNGYTSILYDNALPRRSYKTKDGRVTTPGHSSRQLKEYHDDSGHGTYQMYPRSHDQSGGGMVAVLSEKIDRQAKVIEDLTRQVLTLERENEKGSLRLRSLEQEVTSLRQRMSEDGVHLQTEQKVDHFQWEMKGKLEELRCQLEVQNRLETPVDHDWRHAVTKELHELKRQVERECDSLYREIEVIRSKLVRYDVDLTGQHGDTKELARQLDKFKQDFQVNASKVSLQMNSLSKAAHAVSESRNGWLPHNLDIKRRSPRQLMASDTHPSRKEDRRRKKYSDPSRHRPQSSEAASNVSRNIKARSGHNVKSLSTISLSSSGGLSSNSDDETSKLSTGKEKASAKDTDNSLTLSDLDLGSRSDPYTSSQHGFATLSPDSDSLDLEDI